MAGGQTGEIGTGTRQNNDVSGIHHEVVEGVGSKVHRAVAKTVSRAERLRAVRTAHDRAGNAIDVTVHRERGDIAERVRVQHSTVISRIRRCRKRRTAMSAGKSIRPGWWNAEIARLLEFEISTQGASVPRAHDGIRINVVVARAIELLQGC